EHLRPMARPLAQRRATAGVRARRDAYAAGLATRGWRGLVEVAAAALRIAAIPGFAKPSEARAHEPYWLALFRARQQGSLSGVLDAAEAFGALGDGTMVEQCIRIAAGLAAVAGDPGATDRVRALAADFAERDLAVRQTPPLDVSE